MTDSSLLQIKTEPNLHRPSYPARYEDNSSPPLDLSMKNVSPRNHTSPVHPKKRKLTLDTAAPSFPPDYTPTTTSMKQKQLLSPNSSLSAKMMLENLAPSQIMPKNGLSTIGQFSATSTFFSPLFSPQMAPGVAMGMLPQQETSALQNYMLLIQQQQQMLLQQQILQQQQKLLPKPQAAKNDGVQLSSPTTSSSLCEEMNSGPGDQSLDDEYQERRRRNNDAAKRSRDARRRRIQEAIVKVANLELENQRFKAAIMAEREHIGILKNMILQTGDDGQSPIHTDNNSNIKTEPSH